jgi:uncharacterized membrane protein required for colicin V production
MNIVDAVIIIVLLVGALAGFRRGLFKQAVLLLGLIFTLVLSFYLRVPVATFFYKNLPFFNFDGILHGMSVLNILLYEVVAFLIVFSVLYLVLRILLKITGLIEKLLRATIILGFFSRIGGAIVGIIEGYVIVFVLLFIFKQPFINITGIDDSNFSNKILNNTPILSDAVGNLRGVLDEVEYIINSYKNENVDFNEKTIEIFLKYDIITQENIDLLRKKGKI